MRHVIRPWMCLSAAIVVLGGLCESPLRCAAAETADTPSGEIVAGTWQHHQVKFDYFGFTSLYTCSGLQDQVRQILLHIGARKDIKVTAIGCEGPIDTPSGSLGVNADFYSLAPVADTKGSGTVKARWTPLEVTPRRPGFMGQGDCELVQRMKDLITKNFSLRDIEYRTSCFPHELSMDGFAVKGQALRALPAKSDAVTG